MFSYYKDLIKNTLLVQSVFEAGSGGAVESSPRPEQRPEDLLLKSKLDAIVADGTIDVPELEEALNIIGEEVSAWETNLVLDMITQLGAKIWDGRDGEFQGKWGSDRVVFDYGFNLEDNTLGADAMTRLVEKLWITEDQIVAALDKGNQWAQEQNAILAQQILTGNTRRGPTAEEVNAYREEQSQGLRASQDAVSDSALIETAKNHILTEIQTAARDIASKFSSAQISDFSELDATVEAAWLPWLDGIDLDLPGIWNYEDIISGQLYTQALNAGMSEPEIIDTISTALTAAIKENRNTYLANIKPTGGDMSVSEQMAANQRSIDAHKQYAETMIEGERLAAIDRQNEASDAMLIAKAQAEQNKVAESARTEAQVKLSRILESGDVRFSAIKADSEATTAVQAVLLAELGIAKIQELTGRSDMTAEMFIDGKYGSWTTAAAEAFQTLHELKPDGQVGTNTLTAMLDTGIISDPTNPGTVYAGDVVVPPAA